MKMNTFGFDTTSSAKAYAAAIELRVDAAKAAGFDAAPVHAGQSFKSGFAAA